MIRRVYVMTCDGLALRAQPAANRPPTPDEEAAICSE